MTPYEIEILLHYYYAKITPFPQPKHGLYYHTMNEFVKKGLIFKTGDANEFIGNHEVLKVYVEALSAVPLPIVEMETV